MKIIKYIDEPERLLVSIGDKVRIKNLDKFDIPSYQRKQIKENSVYTVSYTNNNGFETSGIRISPSDTYLYSDCFTSVKQSVEDVKSDNIENFKYIQSEYIFPRLGRGEIIEKYRYSDDIHKMETGKFYKDYFVLEIKTEGDEILVALTKKKILPVFDELNKSAKINNNDVIFVCSSQLMNSAWDDLWPCNRTSRRKMLK